MSPEELSAPLDDLSEYIATYRALTEKIDEWTAMRDALRTRICDGLGDATVGTLAGTPVVRWSRYTTRRLAPDLIRKKFTEEALADCYTETEQRRFTLTSKP